MSKRILTTNDHCFVDIDSNLNLDIFLRTWAYGYLAGTQLLHNNGLYAVIIANDNRFGGL